MKSKRTIKNLSFDGGVLCLNYINTVHDYTESKPFDYFSNYKNWIEWLARLEVIPINRISQLKDVEPGEKDEILNKVHKARSILYRLFRAIARDEHCDPDVLKEFNSLLSQALSAVRLDQGKEGPVQDWTWNKIGHDVPLAIIVKSSYDLIMEKQFNRIKECEMCGWLYLDQSKNNSRRWCNMQACGSVYKARKYYYRKKKEKE